ncbi:Z1 domain-containing protein [Hydrogenophaga sp.]|uniref:Z1 domain-containing protein n=1 Tax=Hydrogenophaga sp. TaxID=1904254 RepID=UPI003D2659B7
MATTIQILKTVKPPLLWEPKPKDFTNAFLESKAAEPNGPNINELTSGPKSVLHESLCILGRCLPPTEPAGRETGLVVGYVQSGKTMSFETVIALARDNGYGLVIVLAGTKNTLRSQSEDRLKKDLGLVNGSDHWHHFSNPTKKLRSKIEGRIDDWSKKHSRKSLLVTVLKHGGNLDKLTEVLGSVNLTEVPTLIVDDESDQASLNTNASRIRTNRVPATAMSTTYERILGLRDVLPHHSYLQYTATPQANLLLAQTDLLNPSFSELVTPGDAYTGGYAFFKGAAGLTVDIPPGDVPTAQTPLKSPPKSLLSALRCFLLVAAQHALTRDRKSLKPKDRNRSMMVHPAAATASHKVYKGWVERAYRSLKKMIGDEHTTKPAAVAAIFQSEYASLSKTHPGIKPLGDLIEAMVEDVFTDLDHAEVNSTPEANEVDWTATRYWILIGGANLDRGYTVEGLCITYMPRALGGSPAADTLQQRARFFGYKKSYLGLCRVFLQAGVRQAFTEYIEHEDFIREAVREASRETPAGLAAGLHPDPDA